MHRSILAVDIEGSTKRTNPVKEELREQVYGLVVEALYLAGIGGEYYDQPFTDRGDGLLVLLRPADELPKRLGPSPARGRDLGDPIDAAPGLLNPMAAG